MDQIVALIWAFGVLYTIGKFKFMNVTALVDDQAMLVKITNLAG